MRIRTVGRSEVEAPAVSLSPLTVKMRLTNTPTADWLAAPLVSRLPRCPSHRSSYTNWKRFRNGLNLGPMDQNDSITILLSSPLLFST